MTRITKLYGIVSEMPRPAGTLGAPMRAALELARQSGQPFTVKQFADWLAQSGGTNTHPASVGQLLYKLVADKKSEVDALHPLMVAQPGRRGKGGAGTYQYVYRGQAGVAPKQPPQGAPAPPQRSGAPSSATQAGHGGDEDDEDLGPGWTKLPSDSPAGSEPTGDEDPDPGEFSDPEGEYEPLDAPEAEYSDEEEPAEEPEGAAWLPEPDAMSSDAGESSMAKCAEKGMGPENEVWTRISKAANDVEVGNIVRSEFPMTLRQAGIRVARAIFQRMGKDWEGGGGKKEGSSLGALYGVSETMTDPVDFAPKSGLARVMRVRTK